MKVKIKKHEKIMKKRAKETNKKIKSIRNKYKDIIKDIAKILLLMKMEDVEIDDEKYNEGKEEVLGIILKKKKEEIEELKQQMKYIFIREKLYDIEKCKEANNEEIMKEMMKKDNEKYLLEAEKVIKYPLYGLEVEKRHNKAINYILSKVEERVNIGFMDDQKVEEIVGLIEVDLLKNYSSYENLYTTWTTYATYEAMKIFSGNKIMYNAILDSATCSTCWSLDGTIYKKGEEPNIPQHYRCRCFYSYI